MACGWGKAAIFPLICALESSHQVTVASVQCALAQTSTKPAACLGVRGASGTYEPPEKIGETVVMV